jgi:NTE family protein
MEMKRAFVLGGGGSRGAMQVGALRALLEAGYLPDLVTGASIGAANGAFLAVHGYNPQGLRKLEQVWRSTINQDLLPTNLWWQAICAILRRSRVQGNSGFSQERIRQFAIANGLTPDLRFRDLIEVELFPVAADLNAGCPVVFGLDPEDSVLECVLASMSLPPWIVPAERDGRYLMDGGAVSNLPIEAALQQGATEIIALELSDPAGPGPRQNGFTDFFVKLDRTVENRQTQLEMELAEARGVPVRRIVLAGEKPVQIWDFRQSVELIGRGYRLARQAIAGWPPEVQPSWCDRFGMKAMLEDRLEVI